jgi:major membrane immunogen (membrane-anchored lipoprotein)
MNRHLCPLELKLITLVFGLAILLTGCSSSYTVSSTGRPNAEYSYAEMNEELTGRDVIIELKDGRETSELVEPL